ncbi:MAG: hypothetical protein R6U96_15040 [Promethearchaeia archaeon]
MKQLTFEISIPLENLTSGKTFTIDLGDDAHILQALSEIDKYVFDHPEESCFPLYKGKIHSYLQLIWNPQKDKIYDDVGIDAYGPNREFMPIKDDVRVNLIPNSKINILIDAD